MKNFTLALCLAVGSVAASSIPTPLIAQTQAQTPDTIAQTFFARVKAGNYNIAVTNFFGPESPAATKKSEMALVASQIESAVDAYGKISECELVESTKRGTLVETRIYICQHANFVTRWRMLFVRSGSGWTGGNLSFDDKVWKAGFEVENAR